MMSALHNYFLGLVLLSASCSAGPTGTRSTSVRLEETTCKGLARALLYKVTEALAVDQLFKGLNCTEQSAEIHRTQSLSVCAPQDSKCLDTIDFTIDQDECLWSILEDLRYYRTTFKRFPDPDNILEQSVLRSIENLIQKCFSSSLLDGSQPRVSTKHENSFEGRLSLCKILKGFQIRSITINRVLNHVLEQDRAANI